MENLTWSYWPTSKHSVAKTFRAKNESEVLGPVLLFMPDPSAKKCSLTFTESAIPDSEDSKTTTKKMEYHCEFTEIAKDFHTTPQAVNEDVKIFLTNYVEENAVLLRGRIPGFKNEDIKLLSSSETKMSVWHEFNKACEETGKKAVCYTKFIDLWQQFHPNVVVAKPMSDLCFTCQQNTCKLVRSANLPDKKKSECMQAQQEHLNCVQTERDLYRNVCKEAENNFKTLEEQIELGKPQEACSLDTTIHYSFDFAQQIHILSSPMQPGPIYFKTPRKCGIFGVMCAAIPQQVNYLIDDRKSF